MRVFQRILLLSLQLKQSFKNYNHHLDTGSIYIETKVECSPSVLDEIKSALIN